MSETPPPGDLDGLSFRSGIVGPDPGATPRAERSRLGRQLHRFPGAYRWARTVRRPKPLDWYGDLDPRSWVVAARLTRHFGLDRHDLLRAGQIARQARRSGRYLCTLPRSGTNWLMLMVASALSDHAGYGGGYRYVANRTLRGDAEWVVDGPRSGWPATPAQLALTVVAERGRPVGEKVFLGCHDPLNQALLDHRRCHTVVTVREPLAAGRSHLAMFDPRRLEDRARLRAALCARPGRFLETWAERLTDPDVAVRTLVVRYEDLCADPAGELARVVRHWDLDLPDATIAAAAERCSRSKMEASVPAGERQTNVRVSSGDEAPLPEVVEEELRRRCAGTGAAFGYAG